MHTTLATRLTPPVRLGLFALVLIVAFGTAAALGAGVHPGQPEPREDAMGMTEMGGAMGVTVDDGDFAITPATFTTTASAPGRLSFRIVDRNGRVVRDGFEVEAERRMHVIVVRRDLSGYQHVHPTEGADGTWSVPVTVADPGVYRVFSDFQRDGTKHVLAADLTVPGSYLPRPVPAPTRTTTVDGFGVGIRHDAIRAGDDVDLAFTVARGGAPVAGIEPYLGARGHLVALREGDLSYLHMHPHDEAEEPGGISFRAHFPAAGRYRLFLQFQVGESVHTAAFTLEVTP
jgi:hypothetical protein